MVRIENVVEEKDGCRVSVVSPLGKTEMLLRITKEQLNEGLGKMREGLFVQVAFPMLNADEREFLISGATPEMWDNMFGEER